MKQIGIYYHKGVATPYLKAKDGSVPRSVTKRELYALGHLEPKYPVPAIPVQVGYQPHGSGVWRKWSYIYICSDTMLWTCWSSGAIIEEKR